VTVNVRGRYAANHTGVRLDAVKQHIGIGSLPYFTARQALDDGEVVQVLPQWGFPQQLPRRAVVAVCPQSVPAAQAAGVYRLSGGLPGERAAAKAPCVR
jgi:DNA-binding transcriptional LysR family regulator